MEDKHAGLLFAEYVQCMQGEIKKKLPSLLQLGVCFGAFARTGGVFVDQNLS